MKNSKGKLNYRLKLKLEMKGMKTYGMKLGWNGELELHHATWRSCSKIREGSRHLKLSNSSQDETKQGDSNLTQISLQMSRVSVYQISNSQFYKSPYLYL